VYLVLLAATLSSVARASWPPPVNFCPTVSHTHIPLWGIFSNTGPLCFPGSVPNGSGTTFIPVPVVPVIIHLLDAQGNIQHTLDPTKPLFVPVNSNSQFSAYDAVINSPIFGAYQFKLGSTDIGTVEWGEATLRASFWNYPLTDFKNWHVSMVTLPITPSETLKVPYGSWLALSEAHTFGVDDEVLEPFVLTIAKKYPDSLPIMLTYDIKDSSSKLLGSQPGPTDSSRSLDGYHRHYTDSKGFMSFFIWASYLDGPGDAWQDLTALSHEVAEFMHDPAGNNYVQAWPSQYSFTLPWDPPYHFTTCQDKMEVGDPVEDRFHTTVEFQYEIKTSIMDYHFQNVVTASWQMQAKPAFSVNGWYTLKGAVDGEFAAPAPVCPTK
jgi:hypothetical protein